MTHPVAVDVAGHEGDPVPQSKRRCGLQGTPSLMLIDQTGRLRLHEFGRIDDLRLGVLLGRLLAEQAGLIGAGTQEANQAEPIVMGCDTQACPVER